MTHRRFVASLNPAFREGEHPTVAVGSEPREVVIRAENARGGHAKIPETSAVHDAAFVAIFAFDNVLESVFRVFHQELVVDSRTEFPIDQSVSLQFGDGRHGFPFISMCSFSFPALLFVVVI